MPETRQEIIYRDGQEIARRPYQISDDQLERERVEQRLRTMRTDLRQLRTQAQALADQPANLTQVQLKALAGGVAQLADAVRDLAAAVAATVLSDLGDE